MPSLERVFKVLGAGGGFKGVWFVGAENVRNVFPIFQGGREGYCLVVGVSFGVLEFGYGVFEVFDIFCFGEGLPESFLNGLEISKFLGVCSLLDFSDFCVGLLCEAFFEDFFFFFLKILEVFFEFSYFFRVFGTVGKGSDGSVGLLVVEVDVLAKVQAGAAC